MTWLLLLVFTNPVEGFDRAYLLNTFDTYEDCQSERDRIGFDMAEAYPDDNSAVVVCAAVEPGGGKSGV
jgi:hypothetical protein